MKRASLLLVLFIFVNLLVFPPFHAPNSGTIHAQTATGGENIYAVTTDNQLINFNSATPGQIISRRAITGLQSGESLLGIDFRPASGQLFGLGSTSRVYIIDAASGAASALGGAAFTPALAGAEFGFDFNPVPDRIRVTSVGGQNLRLNPNNGAVAGTDTNLAFAAGDRSTGAPNIVGSAYTNSVAGATTTTLYCIDARLDVLVRQGDFDGAPVSPNTGQLFTVGRLGVDTNSLVGFDISSGDGAAFAVLTTADNPGSALYTINLGTGRARLIGGVGNGFEQIRGMAIAPRVNIYALTSGGNLLTFDATAPGVVLSSNRITGLQSGETLQGIDFRPATGQLHGLGSTSRVYVINKTTGAATQVGSAAFTPALAGTDFGFDFNPVPDRIRVTSNTAQNLRLNPDTGASAATDTNLAFAKGDRNEGRTPNVVGSAYTNNFNGTTATLLYDIDSNLDQLLTQNPPNDGVLNTVGSLGVDASNLVGFDISTVDGSAFAAITSPGGSSSNLYRIDLATGSANLVGTIGGNETIRDISVENYQSFLVLNATDTPDPVTVGQNVTIAVSVANFGPNVSSNTVVRVPLPTGLSFVSATASQGAATTATANNVTTVTASLGALPRNGTATVSLVLKADTAGIFAATFTAISGSGDLNRANNSVTTSTTATP